MCKNQEPNKTVTSIRIAELITFVWAFVFSTGYLIRSFFARSIGVNPVSFLKSENIEVALIFLLLTSIITSVPLLIISLIRKSEKPKFSEQQIYTVLFVPAYLFIGAFGAIFVTGSEWEITILNKIPFRSAYLTYMSITFISIVIPALVRRFDFKKKKLSRDIDNDNNSLIVRVIGVSGNIITTLLTIAFTAIIVMKFDRIGMLTANAVWYFITVFFLATTVFTVCLFANMQPRISMRLRVHGIGLPAIILLYYGMVLAYGSGIYKMIPENRGGAMPLTKTKIFWNGTNTDWVCTVEESPDFIYYVPLSDIKDHVYGKNIRAQVVNKDQITKCESEPYLP